MTGSEPPNSTLKPPGMLLKTSLALVVVVKNSRFDYDVLMLMLMPMHIVVTLGNVRSAASTTISY